MAKKWRNDLTIISYGVDGEVVSVHEPGEIAHCPGVVDGCKFKIYTAIPSTEADRRREEMRHEDNHQ